MKILDDHVDNVLMEGERESRAEAVESRKQPLEEADDDSEPVAQTRKESRAEEHRPDPPQHQVHRPNIPARDEDPIGHLDAVARHFAAENQELRTGLAYVSVGRAVESQVEEFTKDHPDYGQAYDYFVKTESEAARLAGMPEEHIQQNIMRYLDAQAVEIARRGRNPAEVLYDLARQRGYNVGHAIDAVSDHELDALMKRLDADAQKRGYIPGKRYSR